MKGTWSWFYERRLRSFSSSVQRSLSCDWPFSAVYWSCHVDLCCCHFHACLEESSQLRQTSTWRNVRCLDWSNQKSKQTKKKPRAQWRNRGPEQRLCTSLELWRHLLDESCLCTFSTGMETYVTKQMKQMHLEICFLNHSYIMCTPIH